jgi:hypothetical protein
LNVHGLDSGGQCPGFEPGAGGSVVPELVDGQADGLHVEFFERLGLHGFAVGDGGESDGEVGCVVRTDLVRLVPLDPVLGGGADLLAGVGDERGVGAAGSGERGDGNQQGGLQVQDLLVGVDTEDGGGLAGWAPVFGVGDPGDVVTQGRCVSVGQDLGSRRRPGPGSR